VAERTLVGVPFYEREGQECLNVTLRNIDTCLSKLAVDASVIVHVNGPNTAKGLDSGLRANISQLNSEVEIVHGDKISQARAMDDILQEAARRNIGRIFLTDADVYRFTDSMQNMWRHTDKTIVGARYRPYPIEIVEAEFGALTYDERLLYQIFDGDQTPQARHTLNGYGIDRIDWVKASLMLVDVNKSIGMHGTQNQATDSIMNRRVTAEDIKIAQDAFFMHMGRTDMTDHIKARLRHFRAAASLGELETFLHKEIRLPPIEMIDEIANNIRQSYIKGDFYAMLYLCRSAVRQQVNEICKSIAQGTWNKKDMTDTTAFSLMDVRNYRDAQEAIQRFFKDIDWDDIEGFAVGAPPITQEKLRQPFDLAPHLMDYRLARAAIATFATNEPTGLRRFNAD